MSGLEVAGLVLAVMPLFISAFEHYETALHRTHRFFGHKEEVCRYRIRLLTQYAAFSQTLEYLLADFTDEAELDDMIMHGYSELWKNPDLTTKLKSRLGTVYEPFRQALTEMRHDMEQLATVLDIERKERITGPQLERLVVNHKPKQALPRQSPQSLLHLYDFKKRLKFSHKGRHIRPLLEALERHNRNLGGFTEKSVKLSKKKSRASTRAFSTPLHHIQKSAERLHRVLSGIWACSQHTNHVVNLMLEPRISVPGTHTGHEDDPTTFDLIVPSVLSPSVFRSLQVHVLHDAGSASQVQSKVSFATNATSMTQIDITKLPQVDCLCTMMEGSQSAKCIGFCLDHRERLLRDYPLSQEHQDKYRHCPGFSTSLKDVLSSPSTGSRRRKPFTSSQACLLGLTVASSFLQLRSTPWFCDQWRAENFYFIQSSTAQGVLEVERPFIQQTYLSPTAVSPQAGASRVAVNATPMAADDEYAFLRLGIMLLEIFSGEPFPASYIPTAGDRHSVDLATVKKWFAQEKGNMTIGFYNAISECISWFADPRADLQNEDFKREFIEQLIFPLRDELKMYVSATRLSP